jgi:hypothetical protein
MARALPSELIETGVDLGACRATIVGGARKVWALLVRRRDVVYPEDMGPQPCWPPPWLGPHAASHGLTTDAVVKDVIEKTPIP